MPELKDCIWNDGRWIRDNNQTVLKGKGTGILPHVPNFFFKYFRFVKNLRASYVL